MSAAETGVGETTRSVTELINRGIAPSDAGIGLTIRRAAGYKEGAKLTMGQKWSREGPRGMIPWFMPTISIDSIGQTFTCQPGETIFVAAQRASVLIPTACMGRATCGLCRVKILDGEAGLSPISNEEKRHLGNMYYINKLRLSCQTKVFGDVKLQIPDAPRRKMSVAR